MEQRCGPFPANIPNNERRNGPSRSYRVDDAAQRQKEEELEAEFKHIIEVCDACSVSDIDEALHTIRENKGFEYNTEDRFLDALAENCAVENRPGFVQALCEIQNLRFDDVVERIVDHVEAWQSSSAYFSKNKLGIVERLFAFQGSGLFDLRYTGISSMCRSSSWNDQISKLGREPTIKSAEFGEGCVLARQKSVF